MLVPIRGLITSNFNFGKDGNTYGWRNPRWKIRLTEAYAPEKMEWVPGMDKKHEL